MPGMPSLAGFVLLRRVRRTIGVLLAAVLAAGLLVGTQAAPPAAAATTCQPMTLRQRAMQTVAAGLPGTTASRAARHLVDSDAGTVILMGHNIKGRTQLRSMLAGLRSAAPYRLLVASDEEGGRVSRLDDDGLVTRVPAARWLANNATLANVEYRGRRLGREMRDLGVNWNFAPVYDVTSASASSVIGDRSYSGRPAVVARYGGAFARGLRAGGVRTTAKHFPGHGRTTTDSHSALPTVRASRATLWSTDLYPYRVASEPLSAIMTAHIAYPGLGIDGPASLHPATYRLLRQDVGFRGIAITDALEMGAVANRYSRPTAAVMAIRAGADIALTTQWEQADAMTDRVREAVLAGRLPRTRFRQAVTRVLRSKGYSTAEVGCLLS